MILVELAPGVQREYGTVEELALAISRGELTSNSRVYHGKAEQWLPITAHPAFHKQAPRPWNEPLPPLQRTRWTFFDASEEGGIPRPPGRQPTAADHAPTSEPGADDSKSTARGVLGKALRYLRSKRTDPSK